MASRIAATGKAGSFTRAPAGAAAMVGARLVTRGACLAAALVMVAGSSPGAGDEGPRTVAGDPYAGETKARRDARMAWWREARFGMFIHWGVYAVPAGEHEGVRDAEWIMRRAEIPVARYREYARDFNPVRYDPEAWAGLAGEAGMRYMVITAKHHDGFALYPTMVSDWSVTGATPWGKDLLGPLAAAARARGLKFGLYYSQSQDWFHPGGAKWRFEEADGWDEAHKGSYDRYLETIAVPQVREILTRYRPDVLWWDTPHHMTPGRAEPLVRLLELRPGIIHNDRLGGGYRGDTETPENYIPATGIPGRDWETCMTMNDNWGYVRDDDHWKPAGELIRTLVDVASKGGNLLLNVGPKADGTIPGESVERLRKIGEWMRVNGEAIHATAASPARRPRWGRITTRPCGDDTRLYLHVFDWPADGRLPVPVRNEALACRLLADPGRELVTAAGRDGLVVSLGPQAPDPVCSVVVLDISGRPDAVDPAIPQSADGSLVLAAVDALIHNGNFGTQTRYEKDGAGGHIGNWRDARVRIVWPVRITTPGTFDVELEAAAPAAGSRLALTAAGRTLTFGVPVTGSGDSYRATRVGSLTVSEPGRHELEVRPFEPGWQAVRLRSIRLAPATRGTE